jgi:MFS family permease
MAVPDAEADGDPTAEDVPIVPALPPYSQFSLFEKRLIIFMISFAATFSPLSSFIFFPAIDSLSQSLHVSIEKINLTVTSYLIVAGIAPAVIGDMADMTGRRIVYLLTMAIYCSANIGLALQSSWTALFILRMVQSAGSAGKVEHLRNVRLLIGISYDRYWVWRCVRHCLAFRARWIRGRTSHRVRTSFDVKSVVLLNYRPNMAFAVGPVVAGALVQHAGWRWVFWLLAISSGSCLLLIALFLPETSRFIVGNGSRKTSALYRTIYSLFKCSRSHPQDVSIVLEKEGEEDVPARKFHIPNPLTSLKLLWAKDTVILTVIYGLFYTNMSCLQASLSTLFIKIYGISEFQSGLTYMPFGVGACLGGYCAGDSTF